MHNLPPNWSWRCMGGWVGSAKPPAWRSSLFPVSHNTEGPARDGGVAINHPPVGGPSPTK